MALPQKGSRIITVDGVAYRWRVRSRPTYSQGIGQAPMTFAVELADSPGRTLVVTTPHPHPGNWMGASATAITPAAVAASIRAALDEGWRPDSPGATYRLSR
ncbi:hypothetical protein HDA32_001449 [Spinactinospora alkalitolerans]|uniref:Uncharacterized protein n=1 Tax=Spinactinospora alkalitolerans TaxID=687207 RepID=A0A852TQS5_9ACTN|nr:hypothetical protein [Spinactinospora alkalitolerans]NYE46329.1 hypothetical protein [Spinactinospora alkalitolerans]